ncbi:alpha/beta hydrolase [Oleiharenicola lentus]|uniref:alpha/beta hydrolase n=1 Tax=Oleiharenicola lentus TaxID=2508720 RepID=UPI003F66734D
MKFYALFLIWLVIFSTGHSAETAPAKPTPKGPNYAGKIAQGLKPTRSVVYKKIAGQELRLELFEPPPSSTANPKRVGFILIHGGGWTSGAPRAMYPFTDWAAKQGMVGISVQYRLYKPNTENTVAQCVQDARSAIRYIREHAVELGIDPQRLVVGGASAGGHLAVATALFDQFDAPGESTSVSCTPDALVLFSPVIDTSAEGYGQKKIGADWRALSPAHQVRKNLPPTLLFHGTGDTTTPFKGAVLFHEAMLAAGNRCDLISVEGAQHTYMFKDATLYERSQTEIQAFLVSIGFLPPAAASRS